jgi:hypothetical protein
MYSLHLLEEAGSEIQTTFWVVLAIFFVMVLLGWLVASKGWLKPEDEVDQGGHEEHTDHAGPAHT